MSDSVRYLEISIFRVVERTSKKGNSYKCLEVDIGEDEPNWKFVCFL